ncbi:MAG TPA: serine/threonine-protein kinase [Kofleriaceae bacterium]|nr:serine/threonine-protein kinase [Kofleriaceae bacterium]
MSGPSTLVSPQQRTIGGGRYELVEVAGQGGMATVWRARLRGPGRFVRTVAVKHMFPHLSERPLFRAMFYEEARIGSILQDPNLPQVYEFLVDGDDHYLVMEFVDGIDLGTFVHYVTQVLEKKTPWDLIAAVGIGMLRGLAVAHERVTPDGHPAPVIHRDVSPHNVLISSNGPAKLIDFGLSLTTDRDYEDTEPGVAKGKLPYLSPEVALGARATPHADQFAAGTVLWECLVGRRLFGDADRHLTYKRLARADVPPVRDARPDIPPELAQLIHKALAQRPENRFESTRQMAKALGDVLRAATSHEDRYKLLSRWVHRVRKDLGIGGRTQGPTSEAPIQEIESELVELLEDADTPRPDRTPRPDATPPDARRGRHGTVPDASFNPPSRYNTPTPRPAERLVPPPGPTTSGRRRRTTTQAPTQERKRPVAPRRTGPKPRT